MQIAYGLQEFQVVGGPSWIDSDGYNIEAKADGSASKSQIQLMLQSLFEDRFNLKAHRETKELPSYTLIATKGRPQAAESEEWGVLGLFRSRRLHHRNRERRRAQSPATLWAPHGVSSRFGRWLCKEEICP